MFFPTGLDKRQAQCHTGVDFTVVFTVDMGVSARRKKERMNIKITSDSTCDLSGELLSRFGISLVPLLIRIGSETRLDGVDVRELTDKELSRIRNKQIGFIFQQYNLIQNLTVLENVELPLIYQGIDPIDRRELAIQALTRVGLADRAQHKPTQMSGGQQQRVAIARAISTHPPIIMADEPTGALDSRTGHEVLGFLQQLNKEGSTVILITHDNGIAATARRIVRIADGKIIEDHPQEVDWY